MLLGVIADDFTGASDIANTLARGLPNEGGLKTTQYLGVPRSGAAADVEAGVVSLKSRSVPAEDAVEQSLAALDWLLRQGCSQIVFKYCSTFDSTKQGNIGPVAEALAKQLGINGAVACPAFPAMGRTIYQGHLFVRDRLLSESGLENHPLTPMTDPDIRRWLNYQTQTSVGLVPWHVVAKGAASIRDALDVLRTQQNTLAIVDALVDEDLLEIGLAVAEHKLITGGSGIALGLPHNFISAGLARGGGGASHRVEGAEAILAGSCSGATRGQIAYHAKYHPTLAIDVEGVMAETFSVNEAASFIKKHEGAAPLVFSSNDPNEVQRLQKKYGRAELAERLDSFFGELAQTLVINGVRRLVVAGGETSGAVVSALDQRSLVIGPEIDPGVPVLYSSGVAPIALALKSGNFGSEDFFRKALELMSGSND